METKTLGEKLLNAAIWVVGGAIVLLVLALIALTIFRIGWVDYVENYELGYKFDSRTGTTETLDHTGYIVNPPVVVTVYAIDLRPMQVCISANSRTLNCKLIKFNPAGLDLFLSWHGNADYSAGYGEASSGGQSGNLADILKSYAYEGAGKTYPFLTVLRDMTTKDLTLPDTTSAGATVPTLFTPPTTTTPPAAATPE